MASASRRLAALATAGFLIISPACADQFRTAAVTAVPVQWRAALDQLRSEIAAHPAVVDRFTFTPRYRVSSSDPRHVPAFMQLNAATSPIFPGIGQSPVPVLLPFDTAAFLDNRAGGDIEGPAPEPYQSGLTTDIFAAGPAGYDALFSLAPDAGGDALRGRTYARPIKIQITGSVLVYDIADPAADKGEPVRALAGRFPDLKRVIREGFVRYHFTRFGVPYVVSIRCHDSVPRAKRLACREASAVAEHVLRALRIVGGQPARIRPGSRPADVALRPGAWSPDFTYRPPGEIIASSGYRQQGGLADPTVYSQIRFPLRDAPAYANSQSFLNWGDCFQRGRVPPPHRKGARYRCRTNDKPLVFDESAPENYAYPWQDNFCEARDFEVGQCPAGYGHQGQDIRPATCHLRNDGADRCEPGNFPVVAARDGVLLRIPKHEAMTLLVNTPAEHIRFRYMHMDPRQLDADGMFSGRRVTEGEKLGLVSNFQDYHGGTTVHLHFDVQVFTREGWLWVNPYVTLISAYERLIGGRGRELPEVAPSSEAAKPSSAAATASEPAHRHD